MYLCNIDNQYFLLYLRQMELNIDIKIGRLKKNESLIVSSNDTIRSLKEKIISNFGIAISPVRLGLSAISNDKKVSLASDNKKLSDYGLKNDDRITAKDLGIQVSWRGVYVVEYLGPFLIFLIFFYLSGHFNGPVISNIAFLMVFVHYAKRILESLFVHEFSRSHMPLQNLFVNCAYYWGLFGFLNGYYIFFGNIDFAKNVLTYRLPLIGLFLYAEFNNLQCHLILKQLKAENNGEKGIPKGNFFGFVSCANYFWEFIAWFSYALFVGHWSCFLFAFAGLFIMSKWALQRHRSYKRLFPDYPKNRKAILPFIL